MVNSFSKLFSVCADEWDHLNPKNIIFCPSPLGFVSYIQLQRTVCGAFVRSHHAGPPFVAISKVCRNSSFVCQNVPYRKQMRISHSRTSPVQPPLFSFSSDCRPYTDQTSILWKVTLMGPFRVCNLEFSSPAHSRPSIPAMNFAPILLVPVSQLL